MGTSARITTISASSGGPAESMSLGPRYSFQRASDAFRIELRTFSTGVASESDRFTDPDTLVVDTIGFNEKSWLDGFGHPRIKGMRIRETYRRRDFGHLNVAVTIEDPKDYTRPFGFKTGLNLIPDSDVIEYVCAENDKDHTRMGVK